MMVSMIFRYYVTLLLRTLSHVFAPNANVSRLLNNWTGFFYGRLLRIAKHAFLRNSID